MREGEKVGERWKRQVYATVEIGEERRVVMELGNRRIKM